MSYRKASYIEQCWYIFKGWIRLKIQDMKKGGKHDRKAVIGITIARSAPQS